MTNGIEQHYIKALLIETIRQGKIEGVSEDVPFQQPDIESLTKVLLNKQDKLLAILRKSVELAEPLLCDL